MTDKDFKSGFVTLIGRPNVGKSTLMNALVGQKIAIMSDKAQTTRNKIQAIYTDKESQIIFIDTPGIHKPKHALGEFMVETAFQASQGVDLIMMLVNASEAIGPGDRRILEHLRDNPLPKILLINKIDLIHPDQLLSIIDSYQKEVEFDQVIPISALKGINLEEVIQALKNKLLIGPQYYPKDQITDHPEYFVVAEFIREKLLYFTREEIPHSLAVNVIKMRPDEDEIMTIEADIIVERKSQKGIVIGKNGQLIKKVKQLARKDIEHLLGEKVHLDLWVKVEKDWRNRQKQLKDLGYHPDEY